MHNLYISQSLIYLPVVLGIVIVGGLSFVRRSSKGLLYFAIMSIIIALWLSCQALAQLNLNSNTNLILIKLSSSVSIFISFFFVLFIREYTNHKTSNKFKLILLIPCLLIAFINLTQFGITEVTVSEVGLSIINSGILYLLGIVILAVYFVYSLVLLILDIVKKTKKERTASYYILFAFIITLIINLIAAFFFSKSASVQIVSPISILLLVSIIGFAIIRHRLFDIRLVAVRAMTYILSIGLLVTIYSLVAFNLSNYLINNWSRGLKETFYAILAVILALTFAPIKRFFERVTNSIFYRNKYDAQQLINSIGKIMASEIDLDKLSISVIKELCTQMKLEKGEIVVFGEKQLFYENNIFQNNDNQISQKELRKLGRVMVVYDSLQSGERKQLMSEYGISISMALKTHDKFLGYLLLANKKSGDIYTDEDIKVLEIIGSELSVAVQNALSYKEIQLFSETLAQRVRERTAQLNSANEQLRILDQAKDEFISMASHQLRTPLTTVKGYTSMLDEGDFGKLSTQQKEPVQLALDGANRMARLIDDLLNVSRMDANRFFLEISKVDLAKVVNQEITQLKNIAESKEVKLNYSPPKAKIPEIRLDENKTRQAIMNMVDNAIHYSQPPKGGGEVEVSLRLVGEYVEFAVKDNGIGVPAKVQNRLFTKMFRANNAKEIRPDGTGLGLYLVKRVIHDEGGDIIFESTEGKGSIFGFKLPLSGVPKSMEDKSRKIGARVSATSKS